jgi:hypothetical protein
VYIPLCQQQQGIPLKPGRHKFPLQVAIPESIPSSYGWLVDWVLGEFLNADFFLPESQFGSVRYTIKVTLLTTMDNV